MIIFTFFKINLKRKKSFSLSGTNCVVVWQQNKQKNILFNVVLIYIAFTKSQNVMEKVQYI